MREDTGYALYDSDENVLIGVIKCSTQDEKEVVDITKKIKTMIQEHFGAEDVKLHSLPEVVLQPSMIGSESFGAFTLEDDEDCERTLEICTVVVY